MKFLTRRRLLVASSAAGLVNVASGAVRGGLLGSSRPVPFERGDVVVGCTLLNDPTDDHRGRGRLLHYDGALKLKNTIWIDDTTHILQGTRVAPDGTLWAFDAFAYKIVRFNRARRRLPDFEAPPRAFAHITFAPDGSFFLGENLVGAESRVPLHTTLPYIPGTRSFGHGHLFKFSAAGKFLREFHTQTHGGISGFQGLTASVLANDGSTIVYTSESGPKTFHYDVRNDRQLPDIASFADNTGHFFFDVTFDRSGRLLVVAGLKIIAMDMQGSTLQEYPLPNFGWASMSQPVISDHVYVTNFFSGELAKLNLNTGEVSAIAQTRIHKSLSGVTEMVG